MTPKNVKTVTFHIISLLPILKVHLFSSTAEWLTTRKSFTENFWGNKFNALFNLYFFIEITAIFLVTMRKQHFQFFYFSVFYLRRLPSG